MSHFYISFTYLTLFNFLLLIIIYVLYKTHSDAINTSSLNSLEKSNRNDRMETIIIDTKVGKIEGLKEKISSKEIFTFLGIPYAEVPIGEFRFQTPKIKKRWNKIYQAFNWPNPCMQPDQSLQLKNQNFSEDCLYLNIWSPKFNDKNEEKKPVVVIIHTGAFIFGSASETKYNGIFLSHQANVVVVTFNYRLNFYGFFYSSNHSAITPNVGILDQVAALKWVKENIESFHGDPNKITLIGQSSGALSIGMHITSPMSQNLFSRAILLSGSPLQINELTQPREVETFWFNYIEYLNCKNFIKLEDMIKCLDSKIKTNRNNLISMKLVKKFSLDGLFVNIPIVIDGNFQPKNQVTMLNEMKHNTKNNLSILFGYTNDEGSWISMLEDPKIFGPRIKFYMSHAQALKTAETLFDKIYTNNKLINRTKIINYYLDYLLEFQRKNLPENITDNSDQMKIILHRLISHMLGDRYIICPIEIFIDLLLKKNNESSIYQYYWQYKGNHRTSAFWNIFSRVWCGNWMGSCHSFEMFAALGIPFLEPLLFNHSDRMISLKFIQIIKYFVSKGKLFWPPFQGDQKLFYNIDTEYDKYIFGNNFKNVHCKQMWPY